MRRPASAVRLVAGRELSESFRRRSVWIVIGVLLLASTAGMVVPELLGDDGPDEHEIALVAPTPALEATLAAADLATDDLALEPRTVDDEAAATALVEDETVDAAVVGASEPTLILRGDGQETLLAVLRGALASARLQVELTDAGLDEDQVEAVLAAPPPEVERLDADTSGRRTAAFVVSLALYLVLLMLMIGAANGTAIEKSNHISEVLLAIVRPGSLLFGKVIGVGVVGIVTLLAGATPVLVKLVIGGDLPDGTGAVVASTAAWLVLGLVLYLTLAASLGALVERQEEVGSVTAPLSTLLIVFYLAAQAVPDTPIGTVLAYFPLSSPLIMPSRIALGVPSPFELVASLVLGVLAVLAVLRFGSVVYSRAVVRTGRRLRLREVLRPA